jgi:hypothetical protein
MLDTDPPLANVEDMDLPRCVPDADEAIVILREAQAQWRKGATQP